MIIHLIHDNLVVSENGTPHMAVLVGKLMIHRLYECSYAKAPLEV